jgi:glycosyltransferase involved in cell wall biosynthesis
MVNKHKLSVIMSVFNDELYVSEAIESILSQDYTQFEFIIINDGSTDNSLNIINQYALQDDRILVINQSNIGLTKSLNKAIKIAKGNFIARMDSDDISMKNRFSSQMNFLESNPDCALIGTNVIKIDKDGAELEKNQSLYSYEDICNRFKKGNCIAHGSVMLNKFLLGDLLSYDENFKYSQDYKLWTKIANKYKILNTKEYLYKLRLHDSSISKQKVEQQSIYAGIISYEFENKTIIEDIEKEIIKNKQLRKKIGISLLMQLNPKLAKKYFSIFSIYYYVSISFQYINLTKIKKFFK